ncbi:GNAT family N-acetyltransferase [Gorillibacterium sp. sgz5001074]|uniref:GNAT family N-acetyltransferase n=1 Tax=Gorillibacterium sp. sgz5001074 TaxID=3446695 RepID=UPI003F67B2F4
MTTIRIREFTMDDYDAAYRLWAATPGMGLSEADEPDALRRYLSRNPGLSFVAVEENGDLAGTVLCGHDGRRGFLYHLAVRTDLRGRGTGDTLVTAALEGLRRENIVKCHIMVLMDNAVGQRFWEKIGWLKRPNLFLYSSNVRPEQTGSSRDCPC